MEPVRLGGRAVAAGGGRFAAWEAAATEISRSAHCADRRIVSSVRGTLQAGSGDGSTNA